MSIDQGTETESHVVDYVRFVGEQDGVPERELKGQLILLLRRNGAIDRAYLARVEYGSPASEAVALCLWPRRPDESLVREVREVFSSMFDREHYLDVIFIDDEQASELARVCKPFFLLT